MQDYERRNRKNLLYRSNHTSEQNNGQDTFGKRSRVSTKPSVTNSPIIIKPSSFLTINIPAISQKKKMLKNAKRVESYKSNYTYKSKSINYAVGL